MDISIIIPTYNGRHLLEKSLPRLFQSFDSRISHEVIVVDNGSKKKCNIKNKKLKIKRSKVVLRYIRLDKNYGFTGAVNEGVRVAKGTYLLILNNDCFVRKDTIAKLFEFLEQHREYVATQPIIKKFKIQSSKFKVGEIENIGYVVDLKRAKARAVCSEKMLKQVQHDISKIWETGKVYGLSATCLLIRKDVFESIGMLDESFHSYLEDVDLFIRLASKKYQYAPCLHTSVSHVHMGTSRKMGTYKQQHDLVNWIHIIAKNYPCSFMLRHGMALFIERLRNINGLLKAYLS